MAEESPPGWVRQQDLSSQLPLPSYCAGGFVAPAIPSPQEGSISIRADRAFADSNRSEFRGNVQIIDEDMFLTTQSAFYDLNTERLDLPQGFELAGYSMLAEGQSMQYYHNEQTLFAESLNFSLPSLHAWGSAASLSGTKEDAKVNLRLQKARISFCDPTENSWQLEARRLDLDLRNMQGRARGLRLFIGKAPVIWFPYLRFPLGEQRQTGFLYPSFGLDSEDGLTYSQPIYFNIRPNLDSTTYAHGIQNRGFLWEQELRWLTNAGNGIVGFGYLPRDALVQRERSAQHFRFTSRINRGWSGEVLLTSVSDIDYLRDLPSFFEAGDDRTLARTAYARYDDKNIHWQFGVQNYQSLLPSTTNGTLIDPYERLPYTQFSYFRHLGYGFSWRQDSEYILFRRPDGALAAQSNVYTGDNGRFFNEFSLQWGIAAPQGSVRTDLHWEFLDYQFSEEEMALPTGGSRLGLAFDTNLVFSAPSPVCDCYVTFEPRLYGLYAEQQQGDDRSDNAAPVFDTVRRELTYDSLFTDGQYTGNDRLTAERRLSLGLESRLINLAGGEEYRLRLARAAYLTRRERALAEEDAEDNLSPWVLDLAWFLATGSYVETGLAWDEKTFINRHLAVHLFDQASYDMSFLYYGREETLYQDAAEQIGTGLAWQAHKRWSIFGELRYDLLADARVSRLAGFSYENCCSRIITGLYERPTNRGRASGLILRFVFKPWGGDIGIGGNQLSGADQIYNSILYGINR